MPPYLPETYTFTVHAFVSQSGACEGRTITNFLVRSEHLEAVKLRQTYLQFLALQNIAVSTAGLARSAGNSGIEATSGELTVQQGIDLRVLLLRIEVALGVVGEFLLLCDLTSSRRSSFRAPLCYWLAILCVQQIHIQQESGGGNTDTTRTCASYHWRKGVASTCIMALLTKVFVRTSSLLEALYTCNGRIDGTLHLRRNYHIRQSIRTTPMIRVLRVTCSDAHAKFPDSKRRARYLTLPPRVRTVWIRLGPSLVLAGCRPSSNFLFLR